jgi:hypothetical protein
VYIPVKNEYVEDETNKVGRKEPKELDIPFEFED